MNRIDHAVIGGLLVLLGAIAVLIGAPALMQASPTATPQPTVPTVADAPYREGVLGRPVAVNPLAARTQADRDLVALVFSGLVGRGPDGTLIPDLASRWTVDATGRTWTFDLRPDATWHDGAPVTAQDVVFTVGVLNDPEYTGPGAGSWREVFASVVDDDTVRFDLATPLGGFLELATQPIAPSHLLADVPVADLAADTFGREPVGTGPYVVTQLDDDHATLESTAEAIGSEPSGEPTFVPVPSDPLGKPTPTHRPSKPDPRLGRLEFRFFDDAASLESAFESGELDTASGLTPVAADALATAADARQLRYPGTTLTTILLNQRPSHPELRDPAVRIALLQALDRQKIVDAAFAGRATIADSAIPPTSWAFDSVASAKVATDPAAAAAALTKAGWTKVDDRLRPPGATDAYTLEILSPGEMNPALNAVAEQVAADWAAVGVTTRVVDADADTPMADRLAKGEFGAAVADISIGHDPDLYPLLASSQTRTGGLNVSGVQDAALDALLLAARQPGTDEARKAAYTALQTQLATGRYLLPIAFADEVVVARDTLQDVVTQPVSDGSDRYWDVLTWRLANGR
ncbi:MAG TPA: ABC transporter substrate-binding protein [Candidatus Limnocylindrales bacterium]|nr:ABC transporter substrate-binding protein [Candidatus Limnocylindrales bacterium]